MTTTYKRLDRMPYAQANVRIIDIDEEIVDVRLISYTTDVAGIVNFEWLYCNGTYSQTTRKHIGAFAKEVKELFGLDWDINYFTFKKAFEGGYYMNIHTGEVVERSKMRIGA